MNAAGTMLEGPHSLTISRRLVLSLVYFVFLYPYLIDGVSVNYSFMFVPLAIVLAERRMVRAGSLLTIAMVVFASVFFVALCYQLDFIDESGRRLVSFVLFMTIFGYSVIRVDSEMIAAFKNALVLASLYFSIASGLKLFLLGGNALGYDAKELIGTQDYGFVYLLAFWLIFLDPQFRRLGLTVRYAVMVVIASGVLLTFSRTSIVAMAVSVACYSLSRIGGWRQLFQVRMVFRMIGTLIAAAILVAILFRLFPLAFEFFGDRLLGFFASSDNVSSRLSDQNTSEGTRAVIAMRILEYVARNPVTGAGFLGVWVLPDVPLSSAHNQYTDVLLRTGVVGFAAYALIMLALLRFLHRHQKPIFWAMTGILVYGMFHETFKMSQGSFVLAFLLGMMAHHWRSQRESSSYLADSPPRSTT